MLPALVGGLGLFLLGMILLTDGLKAAAGDSLRRWLTNFTGGPFSALLSGTGITALVQSSSATTLATIGFVSAGLLPFTAAVGVIFGANLGTTTTGWIVSLLGLKLNISVIALPMVGIGVLMKLAGRGRVAPLGLAVAGFGLLFIGINQLQDGMRDVAAQIDPARIPGDTLVGRLLLVGVGALMTVVMQSSSAALATTLAALGAGTINLHHGAALVIGQNLGTTVTAAIAAIGASVPARRTAAAHIGFNLITSVVAFLLLPLLLWIIDLVQDYDGGPSTLAAFHTVFNVLGVMLLFPVIDRYAALITRLVPERSPLVTRHLDASVAAVPEIALDAARRTLADVLADALRIVGQAARPSPNGPPTPTVEALRQALVDTRAFALAIAPPADATADRARHLSLFHALDHLDHLVNAGTQAEAADLRTRPSLSTARMALIGLVDHSLSWLTALDGPSPVDDLERTAAVIAEMRLQHRRTLLERTAFHQESPETGLTELADMQWVERAAYHAWRAVHHLSAMQPVA